MPLHLEGHQEAWLQSNHNFGETSTMLIVRTLSPTSSGRTQVCSLIPSFTDILPPSQAWITGCARVTNPSDSYECIVYVIAQLFVIRLQGQNRREDIYAILISISQGWYYSPTLSPTFRFFTELPILVMIPTPMCYNISWLYGYQLCSLMMLSIVSELWLCSSSYLNSVCTWNS